MGLTFPRTFANLTTALLSYLDDNFGYITGLFGAANGFASLDSGAKVVQNPTNATITPTASKIPIALPTGLLDAGWIPSNATIFTMQSFLTGTGTYTTPANVKYIRIRMAGGGGGGSGSGSSGGGNGVDGVDTSFGVHIAGKGLLGTFKGSGGLGGTTTIGAGGIGLALAGGQGSGAGNSGGVLVPGGLGGDCPFLGGGGRTAFNTQAGAAGTVNTGGGGQGGGANNVYNGAGGGSGAYADIIIINPASSYVYVVGTGGAGGAAGTSGTAGGAGGTGVVYVDEIY